MASASFTTTSPLGERRTPVAGSASSLAGDLLIWARHGSDPATWDLVYDGSSLAPAWEDHSSVVVDGADATFSLLPLGGWPDSSVEVLVADAAPATVSYTPDPTFDSNVDRFEQVVASVTGAATGTLAWARLGELPWHWHVVYYGAEDAFAPLWTAKSSRDADDLTLEPSGGHWLSPLQIEVVTYTGLATQTFVTPIVTSDFEKNFEHIRLSLPNVFRGDRPFEDLRAMAAVYALVQAQVRDWADMVLISQADGIWLAQHADDRDTSLQAGETEEGLRERLRNLPDVVTQPALLAAVQGVIDAEGIAGTAAIMLLRERRAFYGSWSPQSSTGGAFSGPSVDDVMIFVPDTAIQGKPLQPRQPQPRFFVTFSGAASAGNDGTFEITGFVNDGVTYVNAAGVAEGDGGVSWQIEAADRRANLFGSRARAYYARGYRMGQNRSAFVVILPFGCTDGTVAAVQEQLRQKAAGGFVTIVECRENP